MTKEQKNKYFFAGGVKCPFCDSEDIEGEFVPICVDNGGAWRIMECNECHKSWQDCYTFLGTVEVRKRGFDYNKRPI